MPLQDVAALPALAVPQPNRRVVAGRCQGSAIGGPGHPYHSAGMSFKRRTAGASFYLPEVDRLVATTAGEEDRIRSEGQLVDLVAITVQFLEQRTLFRDPQPADGTKPSARTRI